MSNNSDSGLLGAVLLARHGDRQGFFQDPFTYTASQTQITALGSVQEFQLGQLIRALYFTPGSPTFIQGISTGLFNQLQVKVRADAGGERGVIFDSAIGLLQGLFPPTQDYNTILANGSTIVGQLGGYQPIPIESVEPDQDVSLEGWTDCNTFNDATLAFYNSSLFQQVAADNAEFLQSLVPFLDGRSVDLVNMWNIFDFINVNFIHNATFANNLPEGDLNRARALANFHENGVFSSPQLDGIGNIAGRTILPSIFDGMQRITNQSDPLKFLYEAISYKPFISLFNMTGISGTYPELAGVVEYAAATVFELRNGSTPDDPLIRLRFKNGTNDEFKTFNMFGQDGDVPLSLFKSTLEFAAINTTAEWCKICNNQVDRGCATCNNPHNQNNSDFGVLAKEQLPTAGSDSEQSVVLVSVPTSQLVEAGLLGSLVTFAALALAYLVYLFLRKKENALKRGKSGKADRLAY